MVTDRTYFKNWMLCGPLPVKEYGVIPGFLYAPSKEEDVPPSPGDFIHYQDKIYRWQKFPSTDGGIVDLDENYHYKGGAAITYAYCQIKTDSAATVKAFLDAGNNAVLYCNGIACKSAGNGAEREVQLSLKKGVNHVLIKLANNRQASWNFTFRLQDNITVTNHKHKYQLNAKSTKYEVD